VKFKIDQASQILTNPLFCCKNPTVLYSHGYTETVHDLTSQAMAAAFSTIGSYNFIFVNYGAYSTNRSALPSVEDYINVIGYVNAIGPVVGTALWSTFGNDVRKLELIG
jgi:hypothetical protein